MGLLGLFKALGHGIQEGLYKVFGESAVQKVENDMKTILSDELRPIFFDAVNAVNALAIPGAEKRDQAFAKIVTDLKAAGKDLAPKLINLGIELTVNLLKANWVV